MPAVRKFLKIFVIKTPIIKRNLSGAPQEPVRVRFAPSPTGFLHLGGLRTAFYNYLFAKKHNGRFIVRIEDTDQTRIVQGAVEQIQKDLKWSGLRIHEGPEVGGAFGPYVQSQRLEFYKQHLKTLLDNGSAYRCFCTERRLELLRIEAMRAREVPKYDNHCRCLSREDAQEKVAQGLPYCVRLKITPGPGSFNDLIYGNITYDISANEGDPVIIKSDGFPTYHFANVVDDHLMQISHVLRGVEWQISTTKHLMLYRAFNWEPPVFGHLPLLMNADGSKLSKRQGDIKIGHYRDNGIFPLALINYIASSGGGFEKDTKRNARPKCYTMNELIQQFDISRVNVHSGKLMPERLLEFNRLELKRKVHDEQEGDDLVENVREMVRNQFRGYSLDLNYDHIKNILAWSTNRITKLSDLLLDDLKFIWISPKSLAVSEEDQHYLNLFVKDLMKQDVLYRDDLNQMFVKFTEKHQLKFGRFMKMLRLVLSGLKEGPSVAEMVEILGKKNTIHRLQLSIKKQQLR